MRVLLLLSVFLFAASVTAVPDFSDPYNAVSVVVVGGGQAHPGSTLVYTLRLTNTGDEDAVNVVAVANCSSDVTYTANSLKVGVTTQTDASNDDRAEAVTTGSFDVVSARLGSGATDSSGGTIDTFGALYSFSWTVTVNNGVFGPVNTTVNVNYGTMAGPFSVDLQSIVWVYPVPSSSAAPVPSSSGAYSSSSSSSLLASSSSSSSLLASSSASTADLGAVLSSSSIVVASSSSGVLDNNATTEEEGADPDYEGDGNQSIKAAIATGVICGIVIMIWLRCEYLRAKDTIGVLEAKIAELEGRRPINAGGNSNSEMSRFN